MGGYQIVRGLNVLMPKDLLERIYGLSRLFSGSARTKQSNQKGRGKNEKAPKRGPGAFSFTVTASRGVVP